MKNTFVAIALALVPAAMAQADITQEGLKEAIIRIAEENQERLDNFADVRAQLQPLVNDLSEYNTLSDDEETELKVGAWRQIWTDDLDDLRANNRFQRVDRKRTFQVVFDNGVFYNLTEIIAPIVGRIAGLLRGEYIKNGRYFDLEFTQLRLRRGPIEGSVYEFARRAEVDILPGLFRLPFNDRYPSGPVGAKGDIRTVYIDDEVRIDIGRNLADGVEDLFVLERAE